MSTAVRTTRPIALLRAESLRVRWTFTQAMPVIVVLFGLWAIRISHLTTLSASSDWNGGVLAWLSMFPFLFALPVAALTGALAESRDVRWRGGGAWWRSTSPRWASAARTVVESAWILLALVVLAGAILADAALRGAPDAPWGRIIGLTMLLWISMTGATASGRILHRLTGAAALGIAPVLAMCWSLGGAIRAEEPGWLAEPWTWMPRTALPLVGTHGNSVPLEPGSPIWDWSVTSGFVLCAAVTVVLVVVAVVLGPRGGRRTLRPRGARASQRSDAVTAAEPAPVPTAAPAPARDEAALPVATPVKVPTSARSSVLAAAWRLLPWRIWSALAVALWVIMALTRVIFPDDYAPRLFSLAAVPVTAAVVGIMMWTSGSPGWRGVMSRSSGVRLPVASAFCAGLFTLTALTVAAVITYVGNSGELGIPGPGVEIPEFRGVYSLFVMPLVAFLIAGASYALAALGGVATALVVNVVAAVWSLGVSGDALADTALWYSAYWGWADIAATHVEHWTMMWLLAAVVGVLGIALVRIRAVRLRA